LPTLKLFGFRCIIFVIRYSV